MVLQSARRLAARSNRIKVKKAFSSGAVLLLVAVLDVLRVYLSIGQFCIEILRPQGLKKFASSVTIPSFSQ